MPDATPDTTTIVATPASAESATTTVKAGWKTTEFWLSLAAKVLGTLFATGLLGTGTQAERIAGIAAVVLSTLGYTVARGMTKAAAILLVVMLGLGSTQLMACGSSSSRQSTLQAALVATDAACDTFAAYDLQHQHDLVEAVRVRGGTQADADGAVAPWRAASKPAWLACKSSYRAIAAAGTVTDDRSLKSIKAAAGILADALIALGVKL